ncbi:MAG: hypothetical protein WD024_02130 [Bacillota bacterium]
MPKDVASQPAPLSGGLPSCVDADFLSALGNIVQLVGVFIAVLANISSAKKSTTALDEAEERLTRLQQEVAEVDLQVRRAKRGRAGL